MGAHKDGELPNAQWNDIFFDRNSPVDLLCGQRYLVGQSEFNTHVQRESRTDSGFFGILPYRLAIRWFIDSRIFGAVGKIIGT
jgi:hypothetical protein